MSDPPVPEPLKKWFIVHFAADILFAVPLFLFPLTFLTALGWQTIDPFATRIVAAALFGIGIESYLGRNAAARTYQNMLNLKIIWSGAVILGIIITFIEQPDEFAFIHWLVLTVFVIFHLLWVVWRIRIGKLLNSKS